VRILLIRVVALLVLALIGADLATCETLNAENCDILNPGHTHPASCICCSQQVEPATPLIITPVEETVMIEPALAVLPAPVLAIHVDHPPRA
jgi:hypothetical protein